MVVLQLCVASPGRRREVLRVEQERPRDRLPGPGRSQLHRGLHCRRRIPRHRSRQAPQVRLTDRTPYTPHSSTSLVYYIV